MPIAPFTAGILGALGKALGEKLVSRKKNTCPCCGGEILGPGWTVNSKSAHFYCCSTDTCFTCFQKFNHGQKICPVCKDTDVPAAFASDGENQFYSWPSRKAVSAAQNENRLEANGVPISCWCFFCGLSGVCDRCEGTGKRTELTTKYDRQMHQWKVSQGLDPCHCYECMGSGVCRHCGGSGEKSKP
jgi:hypothetical protein